ncbi:MAG: SDR family NAD(P)-dependent oxidoreductase, partial [Myxococcota bacterium]
MVATICEISGYPAELVTDGADLEADLGIDSIRKMEILGALEKRFGITTAESDYAKLAEVDLATLVAYVEERLGAPAAPPLRAIGGAVERSVRPAELSVLGLRPAELSVLGLRPAELSAPIPRRRPWTERRRGGPAALEIPAGLDPATALDWLASRSLPDPIAAIAPADAGGAAAVGWLRSAARELGRELVVARTSPGTPREWSLRALSTAPPGEWWVDVDGGFSLDPAPLDPRPTSPVPDRVVIVATGGARGILGPCLAALSDLRPRVVLLARTPEREVAAELAALRAHGIELVYRQGDVTDPRDVTAAVGHARATWGRIDLVVHAAGVLRDGPIAATTAARRAEVLAPKWDGARHLMEATRDDDLHAFVSFSSVVARVGNAAQCAYGGANAALESLCHPRARTVAIGWTAWSEVGMASDPRLAALLASRGVRPIHPEAGGRAFRAIVDSELSGTVWVTADPLPDTVPVRWPLGRPHHVGRGRLVVPVPLDPASPCLADHQVGGRPLVPAATWVAALLEAAALIGCTPGALVLDGLDILAPTFVDRPRSDVWLELVADGDSVAAQVLAGGTPVCRARISTAVDEPGEAIPLDVWVDGEPAGGLYRPDLLFHGPAWQMLSRVRLGSRSSGARAEAELTAVAGPSSVATAVDAVHQLLAAWSGRSVGWLGLPVGADRWVSHGSPAD